MSRDAALRILLPVLVPLITACTEGAGRRGDVTENRGDGSVAARRFVLYEGGERQLMLLDSRTGRTWHRSVGAAGRWEPFRITPVDTARNYTPLRGLARGDTTRRERSGGAVLLRFEIHDAREPVPLLLDRRTGRTWYRELRADSTLWWTPLEVVPTDTTGLFAPLRAGEDAPEETR